MLYNNKSNKLINGIDKDKDKDREKEKNEKEKEKNENKIYEIVRKIKT